METKYHEHSNCELINVYTKLQPHVLHSYSYILEILIHNEDALDKVQTIKVDDSRLCNKLGELLEGKQDRVYSSYNMCDIDFFKVDEDKFGIEYSPIDGTYVLYYMHRHNIDRLYRILYAHRDK